MHQFNRSNFAQQIITVRAGANLTRVEFAKKAGMGHLLLKQAEDADPGVREEDLVKIVRAIESLGYEFINGTMTTEIRRHTHASGTAAVTADPSMPGWVRRIYPRHLGLIDFIDDLQICGVVFDPTELFINICQAHDSAWHLQLISGMRQARKYGVNIYWRNGRKNEEGLRYAVERFGEVHPGLADQILDNIRPTSTM